MIVWPAAARKGWSTMKILMTAKKIMLMTAKIIMLMMAMTVKTATTTTMRALNTTMTSMTTIKTTTTTTAMMMMMIDDDGYDRGNDKTTILLCFEASEGVLCEEVVTFLELNPGKCSPLQRHRRCIGIIFILSICLVSV